MAVPQNPRNPKTNLKVGHYNCSPQEHRQECLCYQGTWGITSKRIRAAANRANRTAQVSREMVGAGLATDCGCCSGILILLGLRNRDSLQILWRELAQPVLGGGEGGGVSSYAADDEKSGRGERGDGLERGDGGGLGGLTGLRGFGDDQARSFGDQA